MSGDFCILHVRIIHVQDSNCLLYYIYACAFLTKLKLLVHCMWHSAECFAPWCFIHLATLRYLLCMRILSLININTSSTHYIINTLICDAA